MKTYEVFDIGGSSVKASVMDETGKILNNEKIAIADDVDGFFDSLAEVVNKNKKEYKLEGIAISAPGAVDSETGIIGGASAIPYIHGPNFKEVFLEKTGLRVEIENDANCAALGECWLGAGKEENDLAFVVCGTGIGGAIVKDKRIHKGIHKHGGEFGYTILDYNPEREVHKYLSWSKGGSIQYTYDPEVIILGGAICEREDYIDSIEKYMDELMENDGVIRPVIRKCMYGNDANKVGALYHFLTSNVK